MLECSGLSPALTAGTCTHGTEYVGYVSSETKLSTHGSISSAAACLDLCGTTDGCQTAMLTPGNICYLHTALAGRRTSVYSYSVLQCGDNGAGPAARSCVDSFLL